MLRKLILGAAASLSALVMLPGAAQADHRDGYYDSRYHDGRYYDRRYDDRRYYRGARHRYRPGDYYPIRHRRGYGYGRGYGYNYGRGYGYDRGYRYDRRYRGRCGSGTTGAIVGGAAGALLGREVARDGGRYRYRHRRGGNGTVGAIVGGAVGALVGREIDRSC
jgi:hypothetical protein